MCDYIQECGCLREGRVRQALPHLSSRLLGIFLNLHCQGTAATLAAVHEIRRMKITWAKLVLLRCPSCYPAILLAAKTLKVPFYCSSIAAGVLISFLVLVMSIIVIRMLMIPPLLCLDGWELCAVCEARSATDTAESYAVQEFSSKISKLISCELRFCA